MLYLKEANYEDIEEEYKYFSTMPRLENGFENTYFNISRENIKEQCLDELIAHSKGVNLKEGHVPDTYFFLWDDNRILGLFKIRHYLNDFLKSGPGHISYGILPNERGKGYATRGLALAIEKCRNIIKEDEIYLSAFKTNPASLHVQEKNGARIVGEDEHEYYTRIKL